MDKHQVEVLDSIRGLARVINDELGVYTVYEENMHPSSMCAEVWIMRESEEHGDFTRFKGWSQQPLGGELTIEVMRDSLAAWLADQRKQEAA